MRQRRVAVIGGGASGLVAAIAAARNGATVTLIEQKDRVGKKILSTGNGKCNYTNEYQDSSCYRSDDCIQVQEILRQKDVQFVLDFFEELGVVSRSKNGYIYPRSEQATAVLDVLRMELERLNIAVCLSVKVTAVEKKKRQFVVHTDALHTKGDTIVCDACILATGGKASPVLGSDGSGYALAKQFGHSISPVVPALVQLRSKESYFRQLAGIRTEAEVTAFVDGEMVASDRGELQLTNYGISGIPVFQISRYAAKAMYRKQDVKVGIDFVPGMPFEEFAEVLEERRRLRPQKSAEEFLIGVFPKKLIPVLLKEAQIPLSSTCKALTKKEIRRLAGCCKRFLVPISDTNGFEQAQVCAGGVRVSEICPETMESRLEEGLYLTGELLDADGICGGYNLHWAWVTGYLAGSNAAQQRSKNDA